MHDSNFAGIEDSRTGNTSHGIAGDKWKETKDNCLYVHLLRDCQSHFLNTCTQVFSCLGSLSRTLPGVPRIPRQA
jgi:hypothetical protein